MKKWHYTILIPLYLILVIFVAFGIRYLTFLIRYHTEPVTEVRGIKADVFSMMDDLLYIPKSFPDDMDFDSMQTSVKSSKHFVSNYSNLDKSLSFSIGVAILDLNDYTYISSKETPDYYIDTYMVEETGNYMMIYKTEVSSFFLTGNLPLEDLDTMFTEYVKYLVKKGIISI